MELEIMQRALERERKAREQAERLLEVKSRELYDANLALEEKNQKLSRRAEYQDYLLAVAELGNQDQSSHKIVYQLMHVTAIFAQAQWGQVWIKQNPDDPLQPYPEWYWSGRDCADPATLYPHVTLSTPQAVPECLTHLESPIWASFEAIASENPYFNVASQEGFQTYGAFQINCYNKSYAVLTLFFKHEIKGNPLLVQTVKLACSQISTILERRQSQESLKESYEALKRIQEQLIQSEKMASIGQLAAGVAHEINNPIAFVTSNAKTLKEYVDIFDKVNGLIEDCSQGFCDHCRRKLEPLDQFKQDEDLEFVIQDSQSLIKSVGKGLERVRKIVGGLKAFTHTADDQTTDADVNVCIEEALELGMHEVKYSCEVVKELSDLPRIQCMPSKLTQVFLNLIVNASQAMETKGILTLQSEQVGSDIRVHIRDTGKGIPEENLSKLFDPFFTTKPVGEGTGLGLSISYGIIENHGGKISVESRLGQGTSFTITLPTKKH